MLRKVRVWPVVPQMNKEQSLGPSPIHLTPRSKAYSHSPHTILLATGQPRSLHRNHLTKII